MKDHSIYDYAAAALAVVLGQMLHWPHISLNASLALFQGLINALNTALLAFSGVLATEAAKHLIKIIKQKLSNNDTTNH